MFLMETLARACAVNFEVEVRGLVFVVRDRDTARAGEWPMTYSYHCDSQVTLLDLDAEVSVKEDELRERQAKEALRRQAFSKLTPEEREALGVFL